MHPLELGYAEKSPSKKIMDTVVSLTYPPEAVDRYALFSRWMRTIDNIVDEGKNFCIARKILDEQYQVLHEPFQVSNEYPLNQALATIIRNAPPNLLPAYQTNLGQLLDYFSVDLDHRRKLSGFSSTDFQTHIEGGYPACFGVIKLILQHRDLQTPGYKKLARIHGEAEPLGDIAEDLEHGFVLHSVDFGAHWINLLEEGKQVPIKEIDEYVIYRRRKLARTMLHSSVHAFLEFKNVMGYLMTMEYVRRSFSLSRRRFQPNEPVIFAKYKLED